MKHLFSNMYPALLLLGACSTASEHRPYRKEVIDAVYASGFLKPDSAYQVTAQTEGVILRRMVNEGDTVSAGQLLYSVESGVAGAEQAAADAAYQLAARAAGPHSPALIELEQEVRNAFIRLHNDSINLSRYQLLWEQKAIARADYDKALLQYNTSRNELTARQQRLLRQQEEAGLRITQERSRVKAAEQAFTQTHIRSALNGKVFELMKQPGEVVKRNEWVATVGKAGAVYAELWVDENDFSRIHEGQELWLRADAFRDHPVRATITRIYPVIERGKQACRVDARLIDTLPAQVAYTSLEANIVIRKNSRALVIPKVWLQGKDSVLIKDNGEKKKVRITKGIETLDEVEIIKGVDDNTVILTGK